MELKTMYKTQAQIDADRANFYFAARALRASTECHAFDFRQAVPELTCQQAETLAAAMVSILNTYRAEAEKHTQGGQVGQIVYS